MNLTHQAGHLSCTAIHQLNDAPSKLYPMFMKYGAYKHVYRNDPKFSDRYVWANSADPDQTAPRGAV